jgi:phosphoesterase RecJ-like protein
MDNKNSSAYDLSDLKKYLSEGRKRILILTHRNPDGDAIGASLGLLNILAKIGHQVDLLIPNSFPGFLCWIPSADKIITYLKQKEKAIELLKNAEIVFAIDFNDLSRIREFEEHLTDNHAYKVLIDHHPVPIYSADLNISNTESSSTAELVYFFIKAINLEKYIDKDVASCIYVGIMTDTGCFSYNSSRTETFGVVADLLNYGIEKDKIYGLIYDNFSYDRMRLMGYCLDKKMQHLPEYLTAYIALTHDELKEYNFKIGDSDGFVNLPLSIEGVKFSVLFTESKDMIKISMRSKGDFAVNNFCTDHFNGGGHKNAAGGESYDSIQKTIDKFVNLLPKYKNELLKE